MESNNTSLFGIDESGNLTYVEGSEADGDLSIDAGSEGDVLSDQTTDSVEDVPEDSVLDAVDLVDGSVPVALSAEVEAAIASIAPSAGSLASSTLDYFDRVVEGLPEDAVYVAYRTDADNSTNGVLYYASEYDLADGVVLFGSDAVRLEVVRESTSYNSYTTYNRSLADGVEVDYSAASTDVVYYTNAAEGYPILGGLPHDPKSDINVCGILLLGMVLFAVLSLTRRF